MYKLLFFLILSTSIYSQENTPPPPPEEIEKELQSAKDEFERAQKLFNPWYSGPLLTGSGNTFSPGKYGIQPYLYVTDNYARFNENGNSSSISNLLVVNPLLSVTTGITKSVEIATDFSWFYKDQSDTSATGFSDVGVRIGLGLAKETLTTPAVKVNIKEIFPSGRYESLDPTKNGLDATGGGSYKTLVGLAASKIVLWSDLHPMMLRGSISVILPADVHVNGFNAYGGGFGTDGIVSPGKGLSCAFAFEYSITQHWVFANDFVYGYTTEKTFRGTPGIKADGSPATVGGPFSDNFSIAPAIEYLPTQNLNFIVGVWASLWGRNSLKFVSGVFSVYYSF